MNQTEPHTPATPGQIDRTGSSRTKSRSRSRGSSGKLSRSTPAEPFFASAKPLMQSRAAAALAALLVFALIVGGGGSPAPFAELAVEIVGLGVLAWAALARRSEFSIFSALRRDPLVMAVALAVIVLMAVQLIPLPASIWESLPGRAPIVENAKAFTGKMALPFSITPHLTLGALLSLIAPLAAYLVAAGTRPSERDWLVVVLALFAIATVMLEVVQLGGQGFLYPTNTETFPRGFQANRNAQGDILAILTAILACRPYPGGDRAGFTLAQASVGLVLVFAAVMTGSRAGIAMTLVALGIAALREVWAWRERNRKVVAGLVVAGIASAILSLVLILNNDAVGRLAERFGKSNEARTDVIWPDAWYAVQQYFPWGTGFGSFKPAFYIYESQELLDFTVANRAHNEALELLIEGGIPALALGVLLIVFALWRGVTVMRAGITPAARARGAMLVLTGVLLTAHSIVDYPIRSMSIAVFMALLLGLVTADRASMKLAAAGIPLEEVRAPRSLKSSRRKAEAAPQTPGQRLRRYGALAAILVVMLPVSVVSAMERAQRPIPGGLSCVLPTPYACRQEIAAIIASDSKLNVSPLTLQLASKYPALAEIQALHGAELLRHGDPRGTIFLHNSARLGWREPLGQVNAFDTAAAQGDIAGAVFHLDALMRTHPDVLFNPGLFDRVVSRPDVRQEWAGRLAKQPDYIRDLLYYVAGTAKGVAAAPAANGAAAASVPATDAAWPARVELFALARANGLKLEPDWQRTAVLIAYRADHAKAADLWTAIAGPGGWAQGKPAWSTTPAAGALPESGVPFAWTASSGKQSAIAVVADGKAPRRLVTTRTLNGPASRLASISVFLGKGFHLIGWKVAGADPDDLFPSVVCEKGPPPATTLLDPPSTDAGLAAVEIPDGCGGATIAVGKGRGSVPKGSTLSDLTLDTKRLLE